MANSTGRSVSVIDEPSASVARTVAIGARPNGVAVDMGHHTVFVTASNSVMELTGRHLHVSGTVAVDAETSGIAVDHVTHHVLVTESSTNKVSVIKRT